MLRWASLGGMAVGLAALGAARTHQQNFVLFLVLVLGLALAVVAVFVVTAGDDERT